MVKKVCQNCGKGSMRAARSRHKPGVASRKFRNRAAKAKRVLKPNLQLVKIKVNGQMKKMVLCTKCLKKLKKAQQ